jgi:hypothetical protein
LARPQFLPFLPWQLESTPPWTTRIHAAQSRGGPIAASVPAYPNPSPPSLSYPLSPLKTTPHPSSIAPFPHGFPLLPGVRARRLAGPFLRLHFPPSLPHHRDRRHLRYAFSPSILKCTNAESPIHSLELSTRSPDSVQEGIPPWPLRRLQCSRPLHHRAGNPQTLQFLETVESTTPGKDMFFIRGSGCNARRTPRQRPRRRASGRCTRSRRSWGRTR